MSKASIRPPLPTSSSDFALPSSSSSISVGATSSTYSANSDESAPAPLLPSPISVRFRRPSLLAPKATFLSESRLQSPLATNMRLQLRRRGRLVPSDDSESDKERMATDSSPSSSSGNPTPMTEEPIGDPQKPTDSPEIPPTPIRETMEGLEALPVRRRLSLPPKQQRILNLLAEEARPLDAEVKSEAAFQRLLSSGSELPHTPRHVIDRGRYPEEAVHEETQREDTPSDDDDDDTTFAFLPNTISDPINIAKPRTPAPSVSGDEMVMSSSFLDSPGGMMDVEMISGSPSLSSTPISSAQWRYTPPPTTSAVRSNKRKHEDRYDPYANATSKRRAVSPSVSYLRDVNLTPRSSGRLPVSIPISIPNSVASSACSSPVVGGTTFGGSGRPMSIGSPGILSSPTMRPSLPLGSPILRPVIRGFKRDDDEREVDGTGDRVGSLTLAS